MTLKPKQVREVRVTLSARGIAMPKTGWIVTIPEADRNGLQNVLGTHYPPKKIGRDAGGYWLMFAVLIAFFMSGCAGFVIPPVQEGDEPRSGYPTGEEVNAIVTKCEETVGDPIAVPACVVQEIHRKWPDTIK